jgi:hypothetical protein
MGFLKDGGLRPEGEEARAYLESLEEVRVMAMSTAGKDTGNIG